MLGQLKETGVTKQVFLVVVLQQPGSCQLAARTAECQASQRTQRQRQRVLKLLELPEDIRNQLSSGKINFSAACELALVEDASKQAELAQQVASGSLTRDELTGFRKSPKKQPAISDEAKPSRVTAVLDSQRSIAISAV